MFREPFPPYRIGARSLITAAALVAAALPLAACATVAGERSSNMEQLLTAAGFQAVPANTDARRQELLTLPAGRLIAQPHGNGFTYVMADPKGCDCLFLGDAADYQRYQSLALQQKLAQQRADAAADYRLSAMNWGLWGPYRDWGWSGPVFVHGGSRWDRDHDGPGADHDGRGHR
jgi:hypothetical protein